MPTERPRFAWYLPVEGDGRHLGTYLPERPPTLAYLAEVIQAAEAAGFAEILIPTGNSNDSFAARAPFTESWTIAAALIPLTKTIRPLVAVRPGFVAAGTAAHMAATFDQLSDGRLSLNVVCGGSPNDMYGTGLDHDARYRRAAEYVAIHKGLWTQETFAFAGEFYQINEAFCAPRPVQRPHVPLYLGGASEAAKQLAVRQIDRYLLWGEPIAWVRQRLAEMRARAAAERDPNWPLHFGLRIHLIARETAAEARAAAVELLSAADPRVMAERAQEFAGFDSVGQARMLQIAARELWVDELLWAGIRQVRGGAGTALVGSYDEVATRLAAYVAEGIDLFILSGYPHREEALRVGAEVYPRVCALVEAHLGQTV